MRLIIGGPAYRMEVDARHAASLVRFATRASLPTAKTVKGFGGKPKFQVSPSAVSIVGAHYEHGTPVAYARNSMFKGTLAEVGASHLLWLDSDVSIPPDQDGPILRALSALGDRPIVIIPCQQRDHQVNVWIDRTTKLTRLALDGGELAECYAGGFGCVGFNLAWYRAHWPTGPWFRDSWDDGIGYVSEDYGHCRALADRGAPVLYAGTYVDHHARGAA